MRQILKMIFGWLHLTIYLPLKCHFEIYYYCVTQFWTPPSTHSDDGFNLRELFAYLKHGQVDMIHPNPLLFRKM